MNQVDILFELYKEQRQLGFNHEQQRTAVSGLILTLCAIILGIITLDGAVGRSDAPLAAFVVLLGVFGAAFTMKNYERWKFHRNRSRAYIHAIDVQLPDFDEAFKGLATFVDRRGEVSSGDHGRREKIIEVLKSAADSRYKDGNRGMFRWLERMRLYLFWTGLHLIVAALGAGLIVAAMLSTGSHDERLQGNVEQSARAYGEPASGSTDAQP